MKNSIDPGRRISTSFVDILIVSQIPSLDLAYSSLHRANKRFDEVEKVPMGEDEWLDSCSVETPPHRLLEKDKSYGVTMSVVKKMHSYMSKCKERELFCPSFD